MAEKRILSVILALCIAAGLVIGPGAGKAARADIVADYQMEELADATYKIVSYLDTQTKVAVPETISGKKVTVIGHRAFAYKDTLEEVTIPSSVTVMEGQAFQYCSALKKAVFLSGGLREVGDYVFDGCALEEIVLLPGVEKIGRGAFLNCTKMAAVSIPATVTEIGEEAFSGCSILEGITLPSGVTVIGKNTFSNCRNLAQAPIPDGVASIGELAFYGCSALTQIVIPDSVTEIGRFAFERCTGMTQIHLPANVSSIGRGAFSGCEQLQDVYYAGTQEQWDQIAIASEENESLTGATIHFETASEPVGDFEYQKLDDETVEITKYIGSDIVVEIPAQIDGRRVVRIGENAFNNCDNVTEVSIPNGVTSIGDFAFRWCSKLSKIDIPDGVNSIGKYVFYRCVALQEINIPESVTRIGGAAFVWCTALQKINIPNSVKIIESGLFANCKSLKNITLPDSVSLIESAAFAQCSVLEEISIPSGVVSIDDYTFQNTGLSIIRIPESVVSVRENSFANCEKLKDVYYEGTQEKWNQVKVSSIGNDSLLNATIHFGKGEVSSGDYEYQVLDNNTIEITKYTGSDEAVTIPAQLNGKNVTKIAEKAFSNHEIIRQVTIPASITEMEKDAFYECPNLTVLDVDHASESYASENGVLFNKAKTELIRYPEGKSGAYTVPFGVISIGDYAFHNCKQLTEVTVPDGATKIGNGTFRNCAGVTSVTLPESVTEIESGAFAACESLRKMQIPKGAKEIKSDTFYSCNRLTDVKIPEGIIQIGAMAFVYCENLKSINIPASVTKIANAAFSVGNVSPSRLEDVYYGGTKEQWEQIQVQGTEGSVSERLWLNAVIHFKNDPIILPEEPIQPEVRDPKQELDRLKSNGSFQLDEFTHYLTKEQIGIMENYLYTWLAQVNYAYQYSGSRELKERIMKKAGIDPDGDFASGTEQAITHISVNTPYGIKTLEITMGLGKPDSTGNLYPGYSVMHYEILEKNGIPSDVPVSGQIVRNDYTDMGNFIESVKQASNDSLHGVYQWQQLEHETAAGILIDKTAAEIVGNKNGSFSDGTFTIYAKPLFAYSKIVKISCPVDVHVYGMDGKEAGSIVNNQPSGGNQHVRLDMDGETKTVYLAGEDYYLNLRGTGTGTMKYEVEEIANEEVRRNVQFLELQLKNDMLYEGYVFRPLNIDRDLYALRTVEKDGTGGEVFRSSQDSYQASFKKVQGLSLSQKNTSLESDRTIQLSASYIPLDASNPNLRWTTDNASIVRVDENGLITAVGSGQATVTVSTKDGSFLKQYCVIDVAETSGGNSSGDNGNSNGSTDNGSGGGNGNSSGSSSGGSSGGSGPSSTTDGQDKTPVVVSLHYVLQFHANGGTNLSRRTMTLLADDSPGIMPKVQRKDYTFDGWYTDQEGGRRITGDEPLTEASTLYARWSKAQAPAKVGALTLKSRKKGQLQVSFPQVKGALGYQVLYSGSKKFTSAKTKEAGASVKTKTITGLKAGKKYYIKVRAYSADSAGNKIFGRYSAVKSVKVNGTVADAP